MKILVLFVNFSIALSFSNFIVEFENNCSEYIQFQGEVDYMYLFKETQLTLMISQNNSYEVYTYPASQTFTFQWPEKNINNQEMYLNHQEGTIGDLNFTSYHILCQPSSLAVDVLEVEASCLTYKCPESDREWFITSISLVILIFLYGSGKALPGSHISRIIGWGREILSSREREASNNHPEADNAVSQVSTTL